MTTRTALLMVYGVWLVLGGGIAHAQISVFQSSDGTSGTITHLGDSFSIYSDSHGNSGTITNLGGGFQSYSFTSPQGGTTTGTITTFGSLEPPSNLTPAPVLPFTPNGTLMPQSRVAPVVPFSSGGSSSFGLSGRGGPIRPLALPSFTLTDSLSRASAGGISQFLFTSGATFTCPSKFSRTC